MRQSRSLISYLILSLVLSAIFLALKYTSGLNLADTPDPESGAAITSTGPVVRSPTPDSYEQRFRQLEQWLGQTQDAYESRFEQLEQRLAQTTSQNKGDTNSPAKPYEAKLQQLEQWLGQTQDAYESRFEQLEQRLVLATAPHDDRLQKIEQQLAQAIELPVDRLKTIEARLVQTTSRLDELSVTLAALTDDTNTMIVANNALRMAPPAALPNQPAAIATAARPQHRVSRAMALGTGTNTAAVPEDQDPGAGTARRQGKWAINLASYISEKTAARKMESFLKKGVASEMVTANVHGRTIYRVRIAGFDTLVAAKAIAPTVERQLGLKETWIMAN
ncbi:MAG: SPOR domain-containing protein [Gammaproteobacteria bacterium]|nr:SPOR domain-containing protein [Gammaproteobacteria bacterium]